MMRRTVLLAALTALVLTAGCGTSERPRFSDGRPVTVVRDDAPIPMPPERGFHRLSYILDNFTLRQWREMANLDRVVPALDANRFGEVPVSSWYGGVEGRLDATKVGQGPGGDDPGPEASKPWTVTGLKIGGRNPGLIFKAADGRRYICKLDKHDAPVIATAAGAIAARLLWAVGYHIPNDRVVIFDRDDLHMDPEATTENALGEERVLHEADIDTVFAALPTRTADGRYRALVSEYLPGMPRGGFALKGVNADDANDLIPHEDRRSLRALRVFGAWLNHVDVKEDNTLDLYVGEDGAGHLRHYLVDFDGCLGGYWAARHEARIGYAYDLDWREFWGGLLGLGLHVHPYERLGEPAHPEVGLFTDEAYDPAGWRPNYVNDQVMNCDRADAFWAGTVLAKIDDAMIDAAAAAGRFTSPAATAEMARVLKARRDMTVDWAFRLVSPALYLDAIDAWDGGFDVMAFSGPVEVGRPAGFTWRIELLDDAGDELAVLDEDLVSPRVSVEAAQVADHDYVVIRWLARDPQGRVLPPTEAHYLFADGAWGLVGILRDGR